MTTQELDKELDQDMAPDLNSDLTTDLSNIEADLTKDSKHERLDLKRQAKVDHMKMVRDAKKAKKLAREKEDAEIRQALIQLNRENQTLKMKKVEEAKVEEVKVVDRSPVVVTRQPEPEIGDDGFEQVEPSFLKQALKMGAVTTLGLASWWVQNKGFATNSTLLKKKPEKVPPTKEKSRGATPSGQTKEVFRTESMQNTTKVPVFGEPGQKKKTLLGNSGFYI